MKELLLYIARSLVDHPDQVSFTELEGEETVLELRVAPEDMGKVIGRQGRIAGRFALWSKPWPSARGKKSRSILSTERNAWFA